MRCLCVISTGVGVSGVGCERDIVEVMLLLLLQQTNEGQILATITHYFSPAPGKVSYWGEVLD